MSKNFLEMKTTLLLITKEFDQCPKLNVKHPTKEAERDLNKRGKRTYLIGQLQTLTI